MAPKMSTSKAPVSVTTPYREKREFTDIIRLRILRWGEYPALSGGPQG